MEIKRQCLVYFSATESTKKLVRKIGEETGIATHGEYNITNRREDLKKDVQLKAEELLIVGVPSFSGRVPKLAMDAIDKFKGNNNPAIIVCTYGNRDYDDTLLELKDIVSRNGFKVIAAGAFVARHSIFPAVAADRPTQVDKGELKAFVHYSMKLINKIQDIDKVSEIVVKGNFPYKKVGKIPLRPTGNSKCDECGICVHLCPTAAIPVDRPRKTDKKKCIACARCIAVCPQEARAFRGLLYKFATNQFVKKHQVKKPNVTSYIS